MKQYRSNQQGNLLLLTLFMIAVITAFTLIALDTTGNTTRITDRSRDYVAAQAAADGAVDYAYGVWKQQVKNLSRPVTTTEANQSIGAPAFTGFSYVANTISPSLTGPQIVALDQYGAPSSTGSPVPIWAFVDGYPGWRGQISSYLATAITTQTNGYNFRAGVKRVFHYCDVPLFQSMYFYQDNFELYKPAAMIIGGLVHTNSDAYISVDSGTQLTFQGQVSYSGSYYTPPTYPTGATSWSSAGTEVAATYNSGAPGQVGSMSPLGTDIASAINASNPNATSMHELIEPPTAGYTDPPAFANQRLYNKAGIIIQVNTGSTNATSSGTAPTSAQVTVTGANGFVPTSSQMTAIKSAITLKKQVYDQREARNVNLTTLDISVLKSQLTSASINYNNVIYIYDTSSTSNPNAIRLVNGGRLPDNGLTVVSQNPIYVQGDYNTGADSSHSYTTVPSNITNVNNDQSPTTSDYTRKPAAVIGDAVMLLSNNWSDSNASNTNVSSRDANNSTYNMAIVSGTVPSGYTPASGDPHYGAGTYGYSGGGNNFPRFLESWTNNYCTYYGSMVELFNSKTFTGAWNTGNIYAPPTRRWNFDTNFTDPTKSPPGSLHAISYSRGTWSKM